MFGHSKFTIEASAAWDRHAAIGNLWIVTENGFAIMKVPGQGNAKRIAESLKNGAYYKANEVDD
jgi:hypothetical protein